MKFALTALLALSLTGGLRAQASPAPRSFLHRALHPFSGPGLKTPHYSDPKLRGLLLQFTLPNEPFRLSESRQLHVKATLTNSSASVPVILDFPSAQRIEMQLMNAGGEVLTKWSDNRVFAQEAGTVLINPGEAVVYEESIAIRELQPGKVYTLEVFLPKYPELQVRQKFLTAP